MGATMADFLAPAPDGRPIGDDHGGKLVGHIKLRDDNGADALGGVEETPAPWKLLGRLKAIVDAILTIAPARTAFAIAKHDTNPITPLPRAVRVDTAGTVIYRAVDSATDVTITAFAGEIIQARVQYIRATGTAPTGFVGLA